VIDKPYNQSGFKHMLNILCSWILFSLFCFIVLPLVGEQRLPFQIVSYRQQ